MDTDIIDLFLSYFKSKTPTGHRIVKYLLERNINLSIWHCLLFSWNNFRYILSEIRFPAVKSISSCEVVDLFDIKDSSIIITLWVDRACAI